MKTLTLRTEQREQLIPISKQIQAAIREAGWRNGAVLVYCPHTTAALTINENADPDVAGDMSRFMTSLVPNSPSFQHAEGNSDAHIKTSLFGPHCLVIVENGQLRLGTWQGVYFCEWDGPRSRTVWLQYLPGE